MADTNVVDLPVITRLDTPPDRVIEKAAAANLQHAVVLGYDEDGDFFFKSSYADGAAALWLLESAKLALLTVGDD